ncbi:exocyst complex component Sec3-domain-containing protein [Lophiotrema nucula]|uniref:Exocyst complex component Sec3-domain-containing protein n=1 Tax=Lophiotrema nucula TaxID=690887 RepID=A0A6A5YVJ8_9PLEO|nr:exocyst complex component Sec3-domain-containing protein [Lophiotrema nucula]
MDGNPRPRGPPNGLPSNRRPSNESRRPPGAPGGPPSVSSSTPSAMSRAERFDDERRRITESCFAKTDDQGQLIESYITHIRVQEDAAYPQSPPPPGTNPSNKKPRVIIISVRATGRVRLHKARENNNGTFSIGKTWNMEDLSGVENFVHLNPSNEDEANRQKWAGEIGFVVTIQKPYYWEANTAKEKEFFIGSMIKIFHKYTQGEFPVLLGFSATELNSLTGGRPQLASAEARSARRNQSPTTSQRSAPSPNQMPPRSPLPPGMAQSTPPPGERRAPPLRDERRPPPLSGDRRPPPLSDDRRPPQFQDERRALSSSRPPTGDEDRRLPPRRPPTAEGDRERRPPPLRGAGPPSRPTTGDDGRRPPPLRDGPGTGTPPIPGYLQGIRPRPSMDSSIRSRPSREQLDMRSPPSREQMRSIPGQPPIPTPPSQHLTPQSSRSDFVSQRPRTPETGSVASIPTSLSPARRQQADDAGSQRSFEDASMDGAGLGISGEPRRTNGYPPFNQREPSPRGLRPSTAQSTASSAFSRNDEPLPEDRAARMPPPPERRRPPMLAAQSQQSVGSDSNAEFVTPLQSPAPRSNVPFGRKPQEVPERPKALPQDDPAISRVSNGPEANQARAPSSEAPQPPPTSPLPQIPAPVEPKPLIVEEVASTKTEAQPTSPTKVVSPSEDEAYRPGLGPMVKKKAGAADAFRKAAFAAGAFKPRAGGARDKLFAKEAKASDEADGISGVFVPQRPTPKDEVEKKLEEQPKPEPDRTSKERPTIDTEIVPAVTVSSPLSPTPVVPMPEVELKSPARSPTPDKVDAKAAAKAEAEAEVRRKKRRSNQQIMNISKLGIDPGLLDGRGLEFETLLGEFGWGSSELSAKNIDSLESEIKREIARVEAGSWLNHLEQKDDRVEAVEKMLDRAIAECDELEGLLTLYNVELSSLNDDIAFIEAQSQGLQVQTANQKLLQSELQQLVETISITADQLEPLRRAPIGKVNGLKAIEASLVLLYKAIITIDPALIAAGKTGSTEDMTKMANSSGFGNSELATMQALQEKKDRYLNESAMFLDRLKQHMTITFGAAFIQTKDSLAGIDKKTMPSTKANINAHDAGRSELWMLSPVILFAKEVDRTAWDGLIRMYQTQSGQVYQDEIRDNILSWKRFARKPTGDEQDLLFTAQEKETESITGAARKLTVKRSQTLARGLRAASGDKEKEGKADKTQTGKLHAFDVFSRVLDDMGPVLQTEQNFVTDFFHATSTEVVDFPDAVNAVPPEDRRSTDLWARKQFEPDRAMAKRVAEVMEDIFSFWPTEIQNLVEWAVKADPLQGVGILFAVDRKLSEIEDSNQDFLTRTLQKVHERLTGLFTRFVDEQIRAIEDTKVKIKKRKGVIAFMKTFPHFSVAIENMLPSADEDHQLEIRRMVDDAYQKINKAMFESLKVIAKESPAVMATQGQGDPEDKEALNYHILLIENMNHYLEEVDARSDPVLLEWKSKADDEMREHMDLYIDAVIRRPMGKLLEFIESTETLLSQPGQSPQSIASRSSHSKSLFKKLLNSNDSKEVRKGIEALKKRVDKHFGDADDASISRDLVFKVLKECEKKYGDIYDRTIRINQDVYTGEVEMDWGPNEVAAAFRR